MVMQTVTVTVELPEEVARQAEDAGVLQPERLARLIQNELQRRDDLARLNEIRDAMREVSEPMSAEEIEAEIQAYRAEKRAGRASRD